MPTFSTDHLPPHDRFEFWREAWARRVLGLDIWIETDRRNAFSARAITTRVADAAVVKTWASAHVLQRSTRSADPAPCGHLQLWRIVRGGGLVIHGDRVDPLRPGGVLTSFDDSQGVYKPDLKANRPNDLSQNWGVTIPAEALTDLPTRAKPRTARIHTAASGLDVLLRGYLATFIEQAPRLTGTAAEVAVRTLAQLALSARGATDIRDEPSTAAIREALLIRAHWLVEQSLHRPDLTPTCVAGSLGISVRKLHLVFEPSGVSFSRYVLARRLERADRLLREMPQMSVTQAAFAVGFESLSTFFRSYRAIYGASPGERRADHAG